MAGFNCLCKCARYFFSFYRNVFRSETVHLLSRIILESFKPHYFFLTSNTATEYFALRTQIKSDASSCYTIANLDARDFYARFPVSVNSLSWAVCPHLSSALSKFKCLAAKHSRLNPLWTYFLVTCPRLDPNDGITARGCAWMLPEETVVVFVQCVYTDVAKSSISNFRRVGTAFSGELPQARTVLLFGSHSGQIFST